MADEAALKPGRHLEGVREARFGVPHLDELLGGLFWGENVFWTLPADDAAGTAVLHGVLAAASTVTAYGRRILVGPGREATSGDVVAAGFEYSPDSVGLDDLVEELRAHPPQAGGTLLAVDLRARRADQVGSALERAIVRVVQYALQRGIVVFWFDLAGGESSGLQTLSQCVLEVQAGHLRIDRADGRGPQVRGAMLPYRVEASGMRVESTSAASLLGRGLRAIRRERGWSQAQVAQLAGVSGSAISQAERGQHALSLETVVDLTAKLGISIDQLLRGDPPAYELMRADSIIPAPAGHSRYLIDDESLGLRTMLVRVPVRGAVTSTLHPGRTQMLSVGVGLVQVVLATARPILRAGDVLTVRAGAVSSCRNLGDEEALVFWQEFR